MNVLALLVVLLFVLAHLTYREYWKQLSLFLLIHFAFQFDVLQFDRIDQS